jgi:phosphinothricin acetyltransferase
MLLAELISECRAKGCHSMVACICGVNVSSVALHASLGFQQVGLLPEAGRKFGEWLRLLIMQCPLQGASLRQISAREAKTQVVATSSSSE